MMKIAERKFERQAAKLGRTCVAKSGHADSKIQREMLEKQVEKDKGRNSSTEYPSSYNNSNNKNDNKSKPTKITATSLLEAATTAAAATAASASKQIQKP